MGENTLVPGLASFPVLSTNALSSRATTLQESSGLEGLLEKKENKTKASPKNVKTENFLCPLASMPATICLRSSAFALSIL